MSRWWTPLLALLAAPVQPAAFTVREGELAVTIPVLPTPRGPMIRLDDALGPLGAVVVRPAADRYRVLVGGTEIELTVGLSVARVGGGTTEPLAAPPTLFEGRLLVPLSLLSDLVPRLAQGFRFDAARGELQRFSQPVVTQLSSPRPNAGAPPSAAPRRGARPMIVVDAGHGGPDRGMRGPMGRPGRPPLLHEADITLSIAKKLRVALESRGVDVLMTRTRDTLIALADRGRIANRAQGDAFISVHVNAANLRWRNPAAARGVETYFLSEAKTEDEKLVEAMENEVVKYEVEDAATGGPLDFILKDMLQNEYLRESSSLAAAVQGELARVHPGTNRGVKQAGFRVLIAASMPSILVEVGFGSNAEEARYLASDAGQRTIANAIASATLAYLERRSGAGGTGAGTR
jgi:N-acetylmuramoyl-L-alanine amidase